MYTMVAVQIRSEHCAYEVVLNGGTIVRSLQLDNTITATKLNPMLIEGDNMLSIAVAPLRGQADVDGRATLEVQVHQGEHGKHPGDAGKLIEQEWSQAGAPVTGGGYAEVVTTPLTTSASHGRWAWEDATPFTDADRPAIEAVIVEVHAALVSGDYGAMAALTATRDAELARGLDVTVDRVVDGERTAVEPFFGQPDWEVVPLEPSDWQFHSRAGGRLVEVTGPDRTPVLSGSAAGETLEFELTLSNLDGQWTVTR